MRDYAKISPKFWTGETGKAIRKRGSEAVVVSMYLMSSPHSNMLGLYYQPILYIAHETGLGIEGASKGLSDCIECGFCEYDEATEVVWVQEMASYQIGEGLSAGDKRCKGIQKDYETLPNNPFLMAFFDRYKEAFHLVSPHSFSVKVDESKEGASKPHRSQEQEQEQKKTNPPLPPTGGGKRSKAPLIQLKTFITDCKTRQEALISGYTPVFDYAQKVGLPHDFLQLAWYEFRRTYGEGGTREEKKQRDWRKTFRIYVEKNYLKLWYVGETGYELTSLGKQAKLANAERAAA